MTLLGAVLSLPNGHPNIQRDGLLSGGHNCLVLLIYVFVDLMDLTMVCLLLYAVILTAQGPGQLAPCALPQEQA